MFRCLHECMHASVRVRVVDHLSSVLLLLYGPLVQAAPAGISSAQRILLSSQQLQPLVLSA